MQLIFETQTTVNITEKMTSVDTMPIAESKHDSPTDVNKVTKCNSIEINNIDVDAMKLEENGISKELNSHVNDTIMTESPETSDDVVNKDKGNDISAQNGNIDIATTAGIDIIDPVSAEDTKLAQVEPDSENLMLTEENPPEIPKKLDLSSIFLDAVNENCIKESTLNIVSNNVIEQELVQENGDETKRNGENYNSLQPEIPNENTDVNIGENDNVIIGGDISKDEVENKMSAIDTNELQSEKLTETNPEENSKTAASATEEKLTLSDSLDDKIISTDCNKMEINETRETPDKELIETIPEEESKTTASVMKEKLTSSDSLEDKTRTDYTEMDFNETKQTPEDDVTTHDIVPKEETKAIDGTRDNKTELDEYEENIETSDETPKVKIEDINEEKINSNDSADVNKIKVTNHNEEKKTTDETQDNKMEPTDTEQENKSNNVTLENEIEASSPDKASIAINETQENLMDVCDIEDRLKSTDETQENKTNLAVSEEFIMEAINDEERIALDKTEKDKLDVTNNDKPIKNIDASQENNIEGTANEESRTPSHEPQENNDQLNSSNEKEKLQLTQSKLENMDSALNENSDSLGSNEQILNSSKEENSVKEFKENQIISDDDLKLDYSEKADVSERQDISENKVDSPKKVEEIDLKAAAPEAMDVDTTEDLTSDNTAMSNETKTAMDTVFDKLLSEEIISVNSGKTDNLDSDRKSSPVTVIDCDEDTTDRKLSNYTQKTENEQAIQNEDEPAKPKKTNSVCGLSNTLDILSDDDDCVEECKEKLPEKPESTANENKCINLDEDDDVMLIDDSPNEKDIDEPKITDYMKTQESESVNQKNEDDKRKSDQMNTINLDNDSEPETSKASTIDNICKDTVAAVPLDEDSKIKAPEIGEKVEEPIVPAKPVQRPIIPENFLKAFRKNVVDMNRDELEEFCLMKIVEGIIDQTSLSEVKTKLKTMNSYVEEWKKKVLALTKQNRDLQIVLKTVQDEQKKRTEHQVVPLKITRSVGMQVYMAEVTDRNAVKRKAPQSAPAVRNNRNLPSRPSGKTNSAITPIPVPRLVPAANNSPMKVRLPQQVQNATVTSNSPKQYAQNGMKAPSPAQKTEKRPFSSVQSVTVDLTDDEPPAKQPATARNTVQQAPVRLVAQQQLMKPRAQVGVGTAGARKVFIPINPQNNIRPGQTITLKSVPSNLRIRGPGPHNQVRLQATAVRGPRPISTLRHPAPLPEVAKQQQPPNWKALPPAPDLKISKVENGIVISWKIEGYQEDSYEEIASYQLFAYQETSSPPSTLLWKKIGDVKALPLPMACTLTQFMAGYKYYFAVRAVDIRSRIGTFSLPGSILLLNK